MAYVVCAKWTAKAGKEDRLVQICQEMAEPSRAEPGNLFYQAQRDRQNPRLFFLYEQYDDQAAFDAHVETEMFKTRILGTVVPLLESRVRSYWEVVE